VASECEVVTVALRRVSPEATGSVLEVIDRPGVLAAVAGVFGRHGVSIRSMTQEGLGAQARIIFITHVACESDMRATLDDLRHLEAVRQVGSVLRVIADE